jgi:ArsR family metal-binding transcriptional regulator
MSRLKESIGAKHRVLLSTPMVTVFEYNGHEISLFTKGRMLIKNVQNEEEAVVIFQEVMKALKEE